MPYVKKAELVEILAGLGETASVKWTREQIMLRIQELEEETEKKPKEDSDENKLGLELTMNETVEKLKVKAEGAPAQRAAARGDELMGFGKHAGLTFSQVMLNHHDYVTWAVTSYHEGQGQLALGAFREVVPQPQRPPLDSEEGTCLDVSSLGGFQLEHQDEGAQREPCKKLPDTGRRHADLGTVPPTVGSCSWMAATPPNSDSVLKTPDEAASDPDSEELQSMEDNDGERIKALEEELQELRRKRNQKSSRSCVGVGTEEHGLEPATVLAVCGGGEVDVQSVEVGEDAEEGEAQAPQATLHGISKKWETLLVDCGYWRHPSSQESWLFLMSIDEGSRLRVGQLLKTGSRAKIVTDDVEKFLLERWFPLFGKPSVLRTDAESPLRSKQLDDFLAVQGIQLDHVPPEAHWQMSPVERAIQSTKDIMWKLSGEYPEMEVQELFCRALWAQNHRDMYLGYSPLQHAFARTPQDERSIGEQVLHDLPVLTEAGVSAEHGHNVHAMRVAETAFLDEQARERIRRAEAAGHRKMKHFCPGDLVYAWRKVVGRQDGNKNFTAGRFVGPFRVLAAETRSGEEELRPSQCVWLYRGNRLTRAAPQQLRAATPREEAWNELVDPRSEVPWTIHQILADSKHKTYDDAIPDAEQMPECVDPGEDHQETQGEPRLRLRHRRREAKRPRAADFFHALGNFGRPKQPKTSDAEAHATLPAHRIDAQRRTLAVEHCFEAVGAPRRLPREHELSRSPCNYWQQEDAAISIDIPLPQWTDPQCKEMMRDMSAFVVKQIRRRNVELSEKCLSAEEREEFQKAKGKEVNNYVSSRVFSLLPSNLKPDMHQAMSMRWILTWKTDESGGKKAKARCVILGYQDPQYEHRPTASPTMSRTTRQIFLQECANHRFKVYKGDVSGAFFLQGRDFEREMFCIPAEEICTAMGAPPGSIMRLNKAAYGLVQAPLEWFLTISNFLEDLGFERQKSDPCCWGLFNKLREPQGWICGHVDDFLFGGNESSELWQQTIQKIKERFRWQEWESQKFTQCGVVIEQNNDGFVLSQEHFLDDVQEIHLPSQRFQEQELPVTESEQQQMRSVLGCLSWYAYQTGYHLSGPVGLMLSQVSKATVADVIAVNKLLKRARTMRHHRVRVHRHEGPLHLACWVDASHANRPDGSSTKGIFVGWSTDRLLEGELAKVTPLSWQGAKIQRTCRSPASAETRAAVDGEDELYAVRLQVAEFEGKIINLRDIDSTVQEISSSLISDSKCLYDRLPQTALTLRGEEKRSDIESLCLKEAITTTQLNLRWVHGDAQLANSLTKSDELHQILMFQSLSGRWRIVYDESLLSSKKRRALQMHPLKPE
ncbi:RE1 [Symbiodinium microadriaticum]|nr:RE1 [Symbiodinium microadriaticum]